MKGCCWKEEQIVWHENNTVIVGPFITMALYLLIDLLKDRYVCVSVCVLVCVSMCVAFNVCLFTYMSVCVWAIIRSDRHPSRESSYKSHFLKVSSLPGLSTVVANEFLWRNYSSVPTFLISDSERLGRSLMELQ